MDDHPVTVMISTTQSGPDGGLEPITGWAGMMKPAGRRVIFADREGCLDMPAVSVAR
jgi:hypothetical protein